MIGSSIRIGAVALLALLTSTPQTRTLCDGFLPPNDMRIPIGALEDKGLTREQYDKVLDRVQALYGPVISERGGKLEIQRLWDDSTVNAQATRIGDRYVIRMFGGLARHETITQDGFALVACHELGHHIGGFPKKSWASNEGQSDYYANLKCLRRVFADAGSQEFTRMGGSDAVAEKTCAQSFQNPADQAACVRGSMAGMSVSTLFRVLRREDKEPRFDTPDPKVVSRTDDAHPGTQCRLDTYYQGSVCTKAVSEEMSDSDPNKGTCTLSQSFTSGIRPFCWYKPQANEGAPQPAAPIGAAPVEPSAALTTRQNTEIWKGL
jgi:hypothetical protein